MSSRYCHFSSSVRVSPDVSERRAIALLIVVGEQFEQFKWKVLGPYTTDTIYSAINIARKYTKSTDYVPEAQWPLVIEILKNYRHQFEKLIKSIGEEKVNDYAGVAADELAYSSISREKFAVELGDFITTTYPPAISRPFSYVDSSLVEKSVEFLSQPNQRAIEILTSTNIKATEEPTRLSRPQQRFARPRRFSMSPVHETCEKGLFFKTTKTDEDFEKNNYNDNLVDNIAFKDHSITEFAFCEKTGASARERFACASALFDCNYTRDGGSHESCRDSAMDRKAAIHRADCVCNFEKSSTREFEFVRKERKVMYLHE